MIPFRYISPSLCVSIIVGFFIIPILSCSAQESQWIVELRSAIRTSAETTPSELTVKEFTNFPWDQMFIFGPYTPISEIEKALGVKWPPAKESGIENSDTFCLLVFVYQNSIVEYKQFKRSYGDFSPVSSINPYTQSSAVFSVHSDKSGWLTVGKR